MWDAFAGSGALAIEAISRGAEYVLATERDPKAYQTAKDNVEKLRVRNLDVVKAGCRAWSKQNVDKKFDIILCDPPYNDLQLSTVLFINLLLAVLYFSRTIFEKVFLYSELRQLPIF